ncbi:MAG: DNA polymerase III subunit delta [Firmicutes bacterium]|nr:DNA polymerase III subunit delta [Bacillota bacterium]
MERLQADLKSGRFTGVYLLYGAEDYLIHFYSDRLVDKNVAPEDRMMNFCELEGAEATADRIQESTDTYPFMGEKRVTLVRNSDWFSGKKNDPDGQEKLRRCLANLPPTALLIIEEKNVDKRSALYKAAASAGTAVELNTPDEEGLIRFIARELAKYSKQLSRETARYFLQWVGGDMVYQELELEKLASYAGDRQIVTPRDVEAICTPQAESDVFKMTDALGARNRREAMRIYERLLQANEAPQRIFFLLAAQIRRLYRFSIAKAASVSDQEAAQFAGVSPKAGWIYAKQAGRFRREQLESLMDTLVEMDEKSKLGQLDASDAIEQLIASI